MTIGDRWTRSIESLPCNEVDDYNKASQEKNGQKNKVSSRVTLLAVHCKGDELECIPSMTQ